MCAVLIINNLLLFIVTILILLVGYYQWSYRYWARRNLPYLTPKIPFGNFANPFTDKDGAGIRLKKIYQDMKSKNWKHGGVYFFTSPTYIVIDPSYVKNILFKDFEYFSDRGFYYNEEIDPLSAHLSAISDTNKWKKLRKMLVTVLTRANMRRNFENFISCQSELLNEVNGKSKKQEPIDFENVANSFLTEVSGKFMFGPDYELLKKNADFKKYTEELYISNKTLRLKKIFGLHFPKIIKMMGIRLTPKNVTKSFISCIDEIIDEREKNCGRTNDFTQMFIDMKDTKNITNNDIARQNFLFFVPELGDGRVLFTIYELSINHTIQDKLRNEINAVVEKYGQINYDSIQDMKYLNQVIEETFRKYPTATYLTRRCVKDYKVPDENVIIEKDTVVMIPTLGIHYDEEFYPDPDKFEPERFNPENKINRDQYTYLPFGQGTRACPGMHLGLLMLKFAIVTLVMNYQFTVNERSKNGLKLTTGYSGLHTADGIWINAVEIN